MRQVVNIGLLASFSTLAVTGILSFFFAFDIQTTRLHFIFGFATILLVVLHFLQRYKYFAGFFSARRQAPVSFRGLLGITLAWVLLMVLSLANLPPISLLTSISYEQRHKAAIFRPSPLTASQDHETGFRVRRPASMENTVAVEMQVEFGPAMAGAQKNKPLRPAIAVWAETDTGSLIETLFLSQSLAFSEQVQWGGGSLPRHHILPVWRHRYTLFSGVDPLGEIDAYTAATPTHSFSLESYLPVTEEADSFLLFLEINLPRDGADDSGHAQNQHDVAAIIGQPSLVYAAHIDLNQGQKYHLLKLLGHGAGAEQGGSINYNTSQLGDAKNLIEKILVKIDRNH